MNALDLLQLKIGIQLAEIELRVARGKRELVSRNRPTLETLESLRATLVKLEQTEVAPDDSKSISELKRVLLSRIADLELAQILEKTTDGATDKAGQPDDRVLPTTANEENPPGGSVKDDD